jgi:DNA modification methylase
MSAQPDEVRGDVTVTRRASIKCAKCGERTDVRVPSARATQLLCRDCFGKGVDRRPRELNELTGAEWAQASKSVAEYPDVRSTKQREHGAAFPQSLARQQIEIYTRPDETVLDPFVGVGTTLDACAELGRRGVGIELNSSFAQMARDDLAHRDNADLQTVIDGDALRLTELVEPESCDFLLTSPPYGALLKNVKGAFPYKWQDHSRLGMIRNPRPYSDHASDLGNLEYPAFLDALEGVLAQTRVVLRENAYAVWVVKDFRASKERIPFVNFHGHFIHRAEAVGFTLWDIRIYDQTRFRPLVCLGYPSSNFYLNIGHSYLVVLRKR